METLPIVKKGSPQERNVALTFDDGPNPYATPQILDILKQEGCTATFFLIGRRADQYPEIVRRIQAEGHTIGGHSHKHGGTSQKEPFHEFLLGNESIERITGLPVRYVRVPQLRYGAIDNGVLRTKEFFEPPLREQILKKEVVVMDCSIVTHDWFTPMPVPLMLAKVNVQLHNGAIINMHDGSEKDPDLQTRAARTVRMLSTLISNIRSRGYEIADLSKLDLVFEHKRIRK
ncbi:MAG TPA: polysaccharide deacetylase family protein [Candidatus Paceibacterota bacterium]|jgi:peptidoglycan/xylan/chitin deacetylase (PgdA/CDA1 family)